ncbi:MAG: hypothetical protein ACFE9C_15755 [Candidatus Hodarchaeota archaeon]
MNRAEEIVISIFIALACPITLFVLFWWSTSALAMSGVSKIQEDTIIYASLLGFGIGFLLDIFFLKEIRERFFSIDYKYLILIYFFWSGIALAFSMGTPIGNLLLGTLAGLYFGRRFYYQGSIERDLLNNAKTISSFTAFVTGIESLFIGFLGLREQFVIEFFQSRFDLDPTEIFRPLSVGLVVGIVIIVMLIQYICTKTAFRTAVKINER